MPNTQCLSITIRPLYDIFRDEKFQKIIIDYFVDELVTSNKATSYLISYEHGENKQEENHFQIALTVNDKLRTDNIKTALLTRLAKGGFPDFAENKVWFKGKVHNNMSGLYGYCWKEKPKHYHTNIPIELLDSYREEYAKFESGTVLATHIHLDNLIENIEKYCELKEESKYYCHPWDVVKIFIKQGKLSFSVYKKIKKEDLIEFWSIKHGSFE